ncbi:hypothetical protein K440DRAFT_663442 [Wilcoxina mikolae CBS 423.85]|nr:hypothetical protein K440DRAFT_663442 [Wilcoxina mikolae CBS 423.85]
MATDRNFYRTLILDNAKVLFPSHDPKLITTQNNTGAKLKTLIVSSTTGETLLSQDGVQSENYTSLLSQTQKLLHIKVNHEGLKGSVNGDAMEELRRENGVLRGKLTEAQLAMSKLGNNELQTLREQLMEKKVELAETKLAMANMRIEELQKRIAMLELAQELKM